LTAGCTGIFPFAVSVALLRLVIVAAQSAGVACAPAGASVAVAYVRAARRLRPNQATLGVSLARAEGVLLTARVTYRARVVAGCAGGLCRARVRLTSRWRAPIQASQRVLFAA